MQNDQDFEPLLAAQQSQLSLVFGDSDSIDTKALTILGANIAIVIFINQTAHNLALWEYLLLYGPFVLSLVLDMFSIWPRRYIGPGVTPKRMPDYLNKPRKELVLQLLSDTQAAITHNARVNKLRLRSCLYSITLTGFGFLALLLIL